VEVVRKRSRKKGFTLMEIMVVVLILGLIAGYAIPRYLSGIRTAKLGQVIANYETARTETWAAYYVPGSTETTAAQIVGKQYGTGGNAPLSNPFGNEPVIEYDGTNYHKWDSSTDTWAIADYTLVGGEVVLVCDITDKIIVIANDDIAAIDATEVGATTDDPTTYLKKVTINDPKL